MKSSKKRSPQIFLGDFSKKRMVKHWRLIKEKILKKFNGLWKKTIKIKRVKR